MIEKPNVRIFPEQQSLAKAAVEILVKDLQAAIGSKGRACWIIAGGGTPLLAYKILADDFSQALDWSKVDVVIGDERCVPFESVESSWTQVEQAFGGRVRFSDRTRRPQTNLSAEAAATDYEQFLLGLPQSDAGIPMVDHLWLGVGEDGHTLSLFPAHPSLTSSEALVIPVHDSPKPPPDRISLTFKALQGVSNCLIIASGEGKASAISRTFSGDLSLPVAQAAATVQKTGGSVNWLLDHAAASQIPEIPLRS